MKNSFRNDAVLEEIFVGDATEEEMLRVRLFSSLFAVGNRADWLLKKIDAALLKKAAEGSNDEAFYLRGILRGIHLHKISPQPSQGIER